MPEFRHLTDETLRGIAEDAARSMRTRAQQAASDAPGTPLTPAEAIGALPLLADGVAGRRSADVVHVATPEGITPCGGGHHDVTVDARIDQATCLECLRTLAQLAPTEAPGDDAEPCRSFTVMEGIDVYCEHSSGAGHGGLHCADVAGCTRTWTDAQAAPGLANYRTLLVAEALGANPQDAADLISDDPADAWERAYAAWSMLRADLDRYRRGDSPVLDRLAQLERDMGRVEHDRAEDSSRLALLDDRVRSVESEWGPVVWSDAAAPGGYVCAAPAPTGLCGEPVESEPCREHSLAGQLAAALDRIAALESLTASQADLLEKHSRDLEPAAREQARPEREPLTALDLLRMPLREHPRRGRFTEATDT
ncbi:hypothetical protein [Nocardiopsis synnemataformans]|uniref:hypothetical protein n=1 Tax=Nocardiopsis synnemataformans TaxID=61305 RepID=UPI003EB901EB